MGRPKQQPLAVLSANSLQEVFRGITSLSGVDATGIPDQPLDQLGTSLFATFEEMYRRGAERDTAFDTGIKYSKSLTSSAVRLSAPYTHGQTPRRTFTVVDRQIDGTDQTKLEARFHAAKVDGAYEASVHLSTSGYSEPSVIALAGLFGLETTDIQVSRERGKRRQFEGTVSLSDNPEAAAARARRAFGLGLAILDVSGLVPEHLPYTY